MTSLLNRFTRTCLKSVLLITLLAPSAQALDLDEAKAQGLVGEQPNGYLGVVQNGVGVDALVHDINDKRRQAYQSKAENAGVDLPIMEQRIGERLIQRTPSGQYIRLPSGRWQKK